MSDNLEPDPLERLLTPRLASPDPALRREVLRRTGGIVVRRLWLRRTAWVAALAACYLAGLLTPRVSAPAPPLPDVVRQHPGAETPAPAVNETALTMENRALDSIEARSTLYRQAGDRYLIEERDPGSALRCYRQAIQSGSDEDLQIKPEDNWLMIVLKESRRKEKEDVVRP